VPTRRVNSAGTEPGLVLPIKVLWLVRSAWFILIGGAFWYLSTVVLWRAYDMPAFIRGGGLELGHARSACSAMGMILTLLTSLVWFVEERRSPGLSWWRVSWRITYRTAAILLAYLTVTMALRSLIHPGPLFNDRVTFLGRVHAEFFAEVGWLSFAFVVIPLMSVISGVLSVVNVCFLPIKRGGWVFGLAELPKSRN